MDTLPKKLASYIHDTGLKALDHLAESSEEAPEALQTLLGSWRSMTPEQKDEFVTRVSIAVGEAIAASALLPVGIKVGKKAVKSAKKVLKKSARALKKNAKAAKKVAKSAKSAAPAKKTQKKTQRRSAGASKKRKRPVAAGSSKSTP